MPCLFALGIITRNKKTVTSTSAQGSPSLMKINPTAMTRRTNLTEQKKCQGDNKDDFYSIQYFVDFK